MALLSPARLSGAEEKHFYPCVENFTVILAMERYSSDGISSAVNIKFFFTR